MSAPPFSSSISTGGFVSLARGGFRPLCQVQGTSVMRLGYQQKPSGRVARSLRPRMIEGSGGVGRARGYGMSSVYMPRGAAALQQSLTEGRWTELEERTAAFNAVRTQALDRLRAAAREAGAHAVVDVHIRHGQFGHAHHAIEFTALGTAITSDRLEPDDEQPIPLVSISGTDFWKLVESGVWPLGVVGGSSVVYVVSGTGTKSARFRLSRRSFRNQEYYDYTQGLRHARLGATARLRTEALNLGASGVIGIAVSRKQSEQRDDNLIATVEMLGTAVAPLDRGAPPPIAYAVGLGKA
jgi:uncharacterized protein YbjQ (UPF0145 family)